MTQLEVDRDGAYGDALQNAVRQTPGATAAGAGGSGAGGPWDFEFPVELSLGGPPLTIRWNRGESAAAIADRCD